MARKASIHRGTVISERALVHVPVQRLVARLAVEGQEEGAEAVDAG